MAMTRRPWIWVSRSVLCGSFFFSSLAPYIVLELLARRFENFFFFFFFFVIFCSTLYYMTYFMGLHITDALPFRNRWIQNCDKVMTNKKRYTPAEGANWHLCGGPEGLGCGNYTSCQILPNLPKHYHDTASPWLKCSSIVTEETVSKRDVLGEGSTTCTSLFVVSETLTHILTHSSLGPSGPVTETEIETLTHTLTHSSLSPTGRVTETEIETNIETENEIET